MIKLSLNDEVLSNPFR